MTNLLRVRHSEPEWGDQSPPSKWVLTQRGRDRSVVLGEYLKQRNVDRIVASTEVKTLETAAIAAEVAGIPDVKEYHDLREHERENVPIVDSDTRRSLVIECLRKPDELIYGSEPVSTALARFSGAIDGLIKNRSEETVAVILHGTVIAAFVGEQLNADPVPIWSSLGLPGFVEISWPNPRAVLNQLAFE